jgi:hypothetical protein
MLARTSGADVREWDGPAALPPNGSQSAWGACEEKEHAHASRIHRSRSDQLLE